MPSISAAVTVTRVGSSRTLRSYAWRSCSSSSKIALARARFAVGSDTPRILELLEQVLAQLGLVRVRGPRREHAPVELLVLHHFGLERRVLGEARLGRVACLLVRANAREQEDG